MYVCVCVCVCLIEREMKSEREADNFPLVFPSPCLLSHFLLSPHVSFQAFVLMGKRLTNVENDLMLSHSPALFPLFFLLLSLVFALMGKRLTTEEADMFRFFFPFSLFRSPFSTGLCINGQTAHERGGCVFVQKV